jgi:ubiquinone/menaquinone biosynthesis C-methylase UbiE
MTTCNLCGSDSFNTKAGYTWFIDLQDPYQICECTECGLIFLNPRPTTEELIELYAGEPYFARDNADRGASRTEFYTTRMRRLESAVPQKGRLLGIGCLEGGYALEIAQNLGWDVTGVESSEILASYAREQLSIKVATASSWNLSDLTDNSFDAVYTHSFEHFSDPSAMLSECLRVLRPSGTIMIEVPNQFYSVKDKVRKLGMEVLGEHRYKVFRKPPPLHFHLYYYSSNSIRQMLEKRGFTVQRLKTYIPWHPVYHCNEKGKWVQEALYAIGGLFGRGPSLEILATADKAAG